MLSKSSEVSDSVVFRSVQEHETVFAAWLDRLPVGTVVSAEAIRRWRPSSVTGSSRWLLIECDKSFDYPAYVRWLRGLPAEGVIVDPSDHRYQRFLQESLSN